MGRLVESPHKKEAMVNKTVDTTKSLTSPKRLASHPVKGKTIAVLTVKLVITQVPSSGLTDIKPAIVGIATLAIEVSKIFMKIPRETATVNKNKVAPLSGFSDSLILLFWWFAIFYETYIF